MRTSTRAFIQYPSYFLLRPFPTPTTNNYLRRSKRQMTSTSSDTVYFHKWKIDPSQIFFNSTHCYGLINLKPIVPGHVLLVSKRVVPRLADLTAEEFSDLFGSVHRIGPLIEAHYGASALNIAVQDGTSAGQSVPHVHVHILPRKPSDFKHNDDVYDELDKHQAADAVLCSGGVSGSEKEEKDGRVGGVDFRRERQARSAADMAVESAVLRGVLAAQGVLSTPPY